MFSNAIDPERGCSFDRSQTRPAFSFSFSRENGAQSARLEIIFSNSIPFIYLLILSNHFWATLATRKTCRDEIYKIIAKYIVGNRCKLKKSINARKSIFFFYQMPRELSIRATMGRGKWTESPKRRKRKPAKWRWRDVTRQFPRALGHAWISAKGRQFRFLQSANLCPVPEFSHVISRWLEFKLHRGGFNALLAARENTRENFSLRAIGSLIVSNIYETQACRLRPASS